MYDMAMNILIIWWK